MQWLHLPATFVAVAVNSAVLQISGCPPSSPGGGGGAPTDGAQPIAEADVKSILQKWRDQIYPTLPSDEVQAVGQSVAAYPLDAPSGTEAIALTTGNNGELSLTPTINRRDWAYAVQGTGYTVLGGLGEGQKQKLDIGFWCFLEAALLHTDEVEHLGNVGFHLNERAEHDDARTVLLFARSIDDRHGPVCNNLACAYAGVGDHENAILEAQHVIALSPQASIYHERLATCYENAGYAEAGRVYRAALDVTSELALPGFWLPPANLSPGARNVLDQIEDLARAMEDDAIATLDRYQVELETEADKFLATWGAIAQEAVWDCPARVMSSCAGSGGSFEECTYTVCINCYVDGAEEAFEAGQTFFRSARPIIAGFEGEAFTILHEYTRQGQELVTSSGLSAAEQEILLDVVHHLIFTTNASRILNPRTQLNQTWEMTVSNYEATMQEGCGNAPVGEIPRVEHPCVGICETWTIWFGVGSLELHPDGTAVLTLGQGASVTLEYNFDTEHAGFGVGVGLNIGRVAGPGSEAFDLGGSLMFRSKRGVEGNVDIGFTQPLPVFAGPGDVPPKITAVKYAAFENY